MYPFSTAATNLTPSADDVTDRHLRDPAAICSVQVAPLSADVYTNPVLAAAASLLPSADDVTEVQLRHPAPVRSVHVSPESEEV